VTDDNVIALFARGNQELFHSAFVAWLLDPNGRHGLGRAVLEKVINKARAHGYDYDLHGHYGVETERVEGKGRFDILLTPDPARSGTKGLVIENKIKSFGSNEQPDVYTTLGYDVLYLVLLRETLDDRVGERYPILTYDELVPLLRLASSDAADGYGFVLMQYVAYLEQTQAAFTAVRELGAGRLDGESFSLALASSVRGVRLAENDKRTFSHFYFANFSRHLRHNEPDLVFGQATYNAQHRNTSWQFEKNMRSAPFMEAVMSDPSATGHWRFQRPLADMWTRTPFDVTPRLELWWLTTPGEPKAVEVRGQLLLGTGSAEFRDFVRSTEPFKSRLRKGARLGPRNFHVEPIVTEDLVFSRLAERIRAILGIVLDWI
jgi:hypothetical protein